MTGNVVGIDWGTTRLRAYRLGQGGAVIDTLTAPSGIMAVRDGRFGEILHGLIQPWLEDGDRHVLLSGMVGSRQGWQEAPYIPCPAGPGDIAANLVRVAYDHADVLLVPGLSDVDPVGTPEVMRGEEVQISGVLDAVGADGFVCLPGSHSKWARIAGGRIAGFTTFLSGEMFAALRAGTILGRMMVDGPDYPEAFDRGVARSAEPGHLLQHLFGVRTLGLFGRLPPESAASYLSGLLIGHEVRVGMRPGPVHLVGTAPLCALYARAIEACGGQAVIHGEDAAARGLAMIARTAPWR